MTDRNERETEPHSRQARAADEQATDRRPADGEPARGGSDDSRGLSRRSALATLATLGIGVGSAAAAETGRPASDTHREERITVDGETVLRVGGSQPFVREDGTELRDGGTVRAGSLNRVADDAIGGTISGGGLRREDRGTTEANSVTAHFGTVGGGAGNRAGAAAPDDGQFATVGGGLRNTAEGPQSVVGGGSGNDATGYRSAVAGGGNNDAASEFAVVGGGVGNHAADSYAAVTGGSANVASGMSSAVGGGSANFASGRHSTVAGGRGNDSESHGAAVAGGVNNDAAADGAFVAGGEGNTADGEYSVAAGRKADTDGHDGAVVVGDSSEEPIQADAADTAYFQMAIHARSFNSTSTRARKRNIDPVDPESVLTDVESLDVSTWEFERGGDGSHMGPTAEAFHDTFELGNDEETIATVDADGVALAAIQGLSERLEQRDERIEELEATAREQRDRIDDLEARLAALETPNSAE